MTAILYIIFILDRSGSMSANCGTVSRLEAARRAMLAMIEKRIATGANDRVAIVSFNDTAKPVLPFTPCQGNLHQIQRVARSMRTGGGTELKAPLVLANRIYPADGHLHIILLSDGHGGNPIKAAEALRRRGAIIDTIGVGNAPSVVDEDVMKRIASTVDGQVLYRFLTDAEEINTYFTTEIGDRLSRWD